MDTPFDEPWLADDVKLSEGYSEHFPTKPFLKKMESEIAIDYKFKNGSLINVGLRSKNISPGNKNIFEFITRIKIGIGTSIHY